MLKLKDLLLESPAILSVDNKRYDYTADVNVVTGMTVHEKNFVVTVTMGVNFVNQAIILHSPLNSDLNAKLAGVLREFLVMTAQAVEKRDHTILKGILGYKVPELNFDYSDTCYYFRIFKVESGYYFTAWLRSPEDFAKRKAIIDVILVQAGLKPADMKFEVLNAKSQIQFLSYADLFHATQSEKPTIDNALTRRLKELSVVFTELEADEHVKGATWSIGEKRQHRLKLHNVKLEIKALQLALEAGVTDISKVILTTLDSLGDDDDVVPADVLYAELEKKLAGYGTTAVQILRKLHDLGVDPKKMLRSISEKHGKKLSSSQLLESMNAFIDEEYGHNKVRYYNFGNGRGATVVEKRSGRQGFFIYSRCLNRPQFAENDTEVRSVIQDLASRNGGLRR